MKVLYTALAAAGLAASAGLPAYAASHMANPATMTCADFTAMDDEGQMTAIEALHTASMEGNLPGTEENATEGDAASSGMAADSSSTGSADTAASDMSGNGENASEGDNASAEVAAGGGTDAGSSASGGSADTAASDATGNGENSSEGEMAEENAMTTAGMDSAMAEEMVTKLSDACEGNPDMMAMDAMSSTM